MQMKILYVQAGHRESISVMNICTYFIINVNSDFNK